MPDVVTPALKALARAETLLRILDREHKPEDLYRHVRGVRHEVQSARDHLATFAEDVTNPRLGKVRSDAPETSKRAARAVRTKSGGQRHQVLRLLATASLTDPEMIERTGIIPNSLRPRRGELAEAGYVRAVRNESGRAITRRNAGGQECQLWEITPKGVEALRRLNAGQMVFTELLDQQFPETA